jgi:hypothetical protein
VSPFGGWAVYERPLALRARLATGVPFRGDPSNGLRIDSAATRRSLARSTSKARANHQRWSPRAGARRRRPGARAGARLRPPLSRHRAPVARAQCRAQARGHDARRTRHQRARGTRLDRGSSGRAVRTTQRRSATRRARSASSKHRSREAKRVGRQHCADSEHLLLGARRGRRSRPRHLVPARSGRGSASPIGSRRLSSPTRPSSPRCCAPRSTGCPPTGAREHVRKLIPIVHAAHVARALAFQPGMVARSPPTGRHRA